MQGYLSDSIATIRDLWAVGRSANDIAAHLYSSGIRNPRPRGYWKREDEINAMTAMIKYHMMPKRKKPAALRKTKSATKWQEWTPEKQEAEFQDEYGDYF